MAYRGVRRKVFVSHYKGNVTAAKNFIDKWAYDEGVFIPKQLGVYDDEDFINSDNTDYVMSQIRKNFLGDSTVTIVLMGTCTHSRRYVDWEIKSSLQQGETPPNGLVGIVLPGIEKAPHLPERFSKNFSNEKPCYAYYHWAPTSAEQLGRWIDEAYAARTDADKTKLIKNSQDMWKYNHKCQVCGIIY